jgi:hypothetical protein
MEHPIKFKTVQVVTFSIMGMLGANQISAETKVPNEFTSGTPAKAAEVNDNFAALISALDSHWTRFPDRYYPDWRHESDFYLELPTLAGLWGGR